MWFFVVRSLNKNLFLWLIIGLGGVLVVLLFFVLFYKCFFFFSCFEGNKVVGGCFCEVFVI